MTEPLTPPEPTPPAATDAVPGTGPSAAAVPAAAGSGAAAVPADAAAAVPAAAAAGAAAVPAAAGAGAAAAAVAVGTEIATAPTPPRRRRRRVALLILLLVILGLVALFAGWYLVTRKPVSELPVIPPAVVSQVPAYGYSVYGVGRPTGVAVNGAADRMYVAQTGGKGRVQIMDMKANVLGELVPPATPPGDHVPVYVAVNPATQDVYVSDRVSANIYVYSSDGVYRHTFDPGKERESWLPLGIGFGRDGTMYVTDLSQPMKIQVFAPDGSWVRTIQPSEPLNFPNGVWPDANGNVYVADSNNGRLRVFGPDGAEVGGVARGARQGDLGLPRGVVVDDRNRVYVVDTSGGSVQVYEALGAGERVPTYVGSFGLQGSGDGRFQFPNGIAADTRGHLYVTDMSNNRVQVWSY